MIGPSGGESFTPVNDVIRAPLFATLNLTEVYNFDEIQDALTLNSPLPSAARDFGWLECGFH